MQFFPLSWSLKTVKTCWCDFDRLLYMESLTSAVVILQYGIVFTLENTGMLLGKLLDQFQTLQCTLRWQLLKFSKKMMNILEKKLNSTKSVFPSNSLHCFSEKQSSQCHFRKITFWMFFLGYFPLHMCRYTNIFSLHKWKYSACKYFAVVYFTYFVSIYQQM